MPITVQVSEVIDRPAADVFRFHAVEHVRNHPRWDPDMQLEQISEGPIGVGTIIKRVNSRSGQPVEGTMEVVEFDPNRAFGMVIHDGEVVMHGKATYQAAGLAQTTLAVQLEIPGMDEAVDTDLLARQMQRSLRNVKRLIESEA